MSTTISVYDRRGITSLDNMMLITQMAGEFPAFAPVDGQVQLSFEATLSPAVIQQIRSFAQSKSTAEQTLADLARNAMAANRTFIALPSPTNAQTLAQVKALSRQVNQLIRLAVGDLDGTD